MTDQENDYFEAKSQGFIQLEIDTSQVDSVPKEWLMSRIELRPNLELLHPILLERELYGEYIPSSLGPEHRNK